MASTDRDAEFVAFVAARSPALGRTAYLLTGDADTAQDLLQTALTNLYVAWPRVQSRTGLDAYVRRTMSRALISRWRYRSRRPEVPRAEPPETPVRDAPVEDRLDVLAALRRLPPRQRAVVVLRYYEDLSEREVAAVLGCSVGTVKTHGSRGLARLRELLGGETGAGTPTRSGRTTR
jgi:RNA polymerase sigma-70 factor (sigma-E family)